MRPCRKAFPAVDSQVGVGCVPQHAGPVISSEDGKPKRYLLDLQRILGLLRSPFFFDLRNIYLRNCMTLAGFRYEGVGH